MKLAFISNYFNYHQKMLSEQFELLCENYVFISTEEMDSARRSMGWDDSQPGYVIKFFEKIELCKHILDSYDAVIFGSVDYNIILPRLRAKKLTLKYSERVFKSLGLSPKNIIRFLVYSIKYRRFNDLYLLAASGYAYSDYRKMGCFKSKSLKWGYFPEIRKYGNIDDIICKKIPNSILWVGRFFYWKHPEKCIELAKYLSRRNHEFVINMYGLGPMKAEIVKNIFANNLGEKIKVHEAMKPDEIRNIMEKSQIFIFTSDRHEGWGAVLNEAMNSCCAVVASSKAGSVPYLVKDGENGYVYSKHNKAFEEKVELLLNNKVDRERISKNAYNTISSIWNAEIAATRLIKFIETLKDKGIEQYETNGPCSKA